MNSSICIIILKTFLLPIVEFGTLLQYLVPSGLLQKGQKIWNRGLRLAFRKPDARYSNIQLYEKGKILPLNLRREKSLLKLMFSLSKDQSRHANLARRTRYNTGVILKQFKPKTKIMLDSPFYIGPKIWNQLPNEIRKAGTIEEFDRLLDKMYWRDLRVLNGIIQPNPE